MAKVLILSSSVRPIASDRSRPLSRLQKSTMRSFKFDEHWCVHLPMGGLTGIVANIADQEIGATKIDPRLLQAAAL